MLIAAVTGGVRMSIMVLVAIIVLVLVWLWSVKVLIPIQSRRNLQQQFGAAIEPAGPFVECNVRFVPDEAHCPCIAKATPAGLYLVSPKEALAGRGWITGPPLVYLTEPVLIPWSALEYQPAKFPLWGRIRFDVPSAKATFFVRRKPATELLRDAGRPLP
jgi:hypothetical protein